MKHEIFLQVFQNKISFSKYNIIIFNYKHVLQISISN